MEVDTLIVKETLQQEEARIKVKSFIKDMKAIKFAGPKGRYTLDSFVLLTYDQKTETDETEFISWAKDSSRIEPDYLVFRLNEVELPKNKDHDPYPQTPVQYYENLAESQKGKRVSAIAFGIGPDGRAVLYRLKYLSTKDSFERLKNNPEIFRKMQHILLTFSQSPKNNP